MALVDEKWLCLLKSCIWIFVILLCILPCIKCFKEDFKDEFVVQVNASDWPEVRDELEQRQTHFIKMILPEFYLFKDGRFYKEKSLLEGAMAGNTLFRRKVKHFERIREFTMDPYDNRIVAGAVSSDYPYNSYRLPKQRNCPTFSDMGVQAVWMIGYTGKGVVIAITDAGINTDITDLQHNIISDLSFNYVANTTDVTPEQCYGGYSRLPDHGNNCAGLVGAAKNKVCGDGVAYEAGIVATKIFDITQDSAYFMCSLHSDTSWIAQGLLHHIEEVDVYSNSWGAGQDFIESSETVARALEHGVNWGRDGKGAIYLFPTEYISDPYANDLHTIAVNSLGTNGLPAPFSKVCACTLTSAYGMTSDNHTCIMITQCLDSVC